MRRDDHRRAVLGRHAGEQVDDLAARLRVEVAGRLVGEHDARLDRERARDRDALLLAAREVRREDGSRARRGRPRRAGRARDLRRSGRGRRSERASPRRSRRAVSVGIRLNCWKTKPNERSRSSASSWSGSVARSRPSKSTRPALGRSSAPSSCSSVVLPRAARALERDELAGLDLEVDAVERADRGRRRAGRTSRRRRAS